MSTIDFSKLKEYDSLSKKEQQLLGEIDQEKLRTFKIKNLIENHLSQRAEIKNKISSTNNLILEKEAQVKTLLEQKNRLIDQGLSEDKVKDYEQKIHQLESDAFALFEEVDQLESELKETITFETGARQTLAEIESEVNEAIVKKEQDITNIKNHLLSITEELPEHIKNLLSKMIAKKLTHGPFTKIADGACLMCRFKISKIDENEIDVHRNLKQCPQCTRIFLPYGS